MNVRDYTRELLRAVMDSTPEFTPQKAAHVERQIYERFNGEKLGHVPKSTESRKGKALEPEKRLAVFQDSLTSLPMAEIERRHSVSRATVYRLLKRGPAP